MVDSSKKIESIYVEVKESMLPKKALNEKLVVQPLITAETTQSHVSLLNVSREKNEKALIKVSGNEQWYSIGDLLSVNGHVLELVEIFIDRVHLSENENIFTIELNEKYFAELEAAAIEEEEEYWNELLTKVDEPPHGILDVISFEPLSVDEQIFGLKVGPGAQGNYFYDLGLLDGDVIISINNVNVGSSDSLFDGIQAMRDNDSVALIVMRNDEKIFLTVKTEGYK